MRVIDQRFAELLTDLARWLSGGQVEARAALRVGKVQRQVECRRIEVRPIIKLFRVALHVEDDGRAPGSPAQVQDRIEDARRFPTARRRDHQEMHSQMLGGEGQHLVSR